MKPANNVSRILTPLNSSTGFRWTLTNIKATLGLRAPLNIKVDWCWSPLPLKHWILMELHSSYLDSHSRFHKTYAFGQCSLFWLGMKKDIYNFLFRMWYLPTQQRELIKPLGTHQSSPIPTFIWINISMDFIVGFHKAGNK